MPKIVDADIIFVQLHNNWFIFVQMMPANQKYYFLIIVHGRKSLEASVHLSNIVVLCLNEYACHPIFFCTIFELSWFYKIPVVRPIRGK